MSDETEPKIVAHCCIDMEQHARSFNEGYETAVVQGLADDPALAGDWLNDHDRQVMMFVLAEAEARIKDEAEREKDGPFGDPTLGQKIHWQGVTDGKKRAAIIVAALRAEVGER